MVEIGVKEGGIGVLSIYTEPQMRLIFRPAHGGSNSSLQLNVFAAITAGVDHLFEPSGIFTVRIIRSAQNHGALLSRVVLLLADSDVKSEFGLVGSSPEHWWTHNPAGRRLAGLPYFESEVHRHTQSGHGCAPPAGQRVCRAGAIHKQHGIVRARGANLGKVPPGFVCLAV